MNKLTNKVAVITGGSSGIGLATAQLFAAEGAHLALFARDKEGLAQAKKNMGKDVITVAGDITDGAALARLFEETTRVHGKIDVLFANAGMVKLSPIDDTHDELFDKIIGTNVKGTFLTLRHAIPSLSDGASVILTTSWLNRMGLPGSSAVAMSKAAIRSLARVAAAELGPRKIRVNAISPGATETPLWAELGLPEDVLRKAGEEITSQIPLRRWAKSEELAQAALFLASDQSSYVNGEELQVDGGLRQA
jgi:NAD(P)-dependent dehydrogenase (short-subunit alcohol dehydrogenase family)